MRRAGVAGLLAALVLALPLSARAETDDEDAEELVPGDTAFGQDAGEGELSFEMTFTEARDEDEVELRTALEYGVTGRIQLGLEVPYLFVDPADADEPASSGFDRAELSIQYGLMGEDAPLAVSLLLETALPMAGRGGPGDDDVDVTAGVLLARVWGRRELFGGLQATWADGPTEHEVEAGAVFAFGSIAAEIQVTWTDDGEERTWEVRPAVIVEDLGPFDLEVGAPYVFQEGEDEWGVAVELVWGFP